MTPEALWSAMESKLIAILRGITPPETAEIVGELLDAGFRAIEIPLNSPDPLTSIAIAVEVAERHTPGGCLIGAGTVLSAQDVADVRAVGGKLIVAPNINPEVVRAATAHGMASFPGVFTASEAHLAIQAGATGLKFFPAFRLGPAGIAAIRATLPATTPLCAVGGIGPDDFADYLAAGVSGFGLGSNLYRVGATAEQVRLGARQALAALHRARAPVKS